MPKSLAQFQQEQREALPLSSLYATLAEMGGKLDTVRDLIVTASTGAMTGDKNSAISDLIEAYDGATEVMEWLDAVRKGQVEDQRKFVPAESPL